MLQVHVKSRTTRNNLSFCHTSGPFELGRGPRRDIERYVIADDPMVSRNALRVEEMANGHVHVVNLSGRNPVFVGRGERLETGESDVLLPPVHLSIGQTTIDISACEETDEFGATDTVLIPLSRDSAPIQKLLDLGQAPSAQQITQWLETVLKLQQAADDVDELYARTAKAMVELVGLDAAMVLMRDGDRWQIETQYTNRDDVTLNYSQTLLSQMVDLGQTLIRNREDVPATESLVHTASVVVSPIYSVQRNIVGALYGSRSTMAGPRQGKITELEGQILQLFAVAASTRRMRADAARVRVQFEQFFSPELVQQLQDNSDLLEGREQEITVLVSDLRGFSELSDRLGPQKTCDLMQDMMSRFTKCITDQGGVIVDYAGDGILAMWNAPVAQVDHARRACQAAINMRRELPAFNEKWQELTDRQLDVGIGINTGRALVGNTGSSRKLKYGPHGNTVNVASRVQDATKKLGLPVLVTVTTKAELPADFATRRLFSARLRGIHNDVELFELRDANTTGKWQLQRDTYEAALSQYEEGDWCRACQALVGLMEVFQNDDSIDIPTVRLLRNAWDCLEGGTNIDAVVDLS